MSIASHPSRTMKYELIVAIVTFCFVVIGMFVGASIFPLFSSQALPAGIQEDQRLDLQRCFFTAWAALILVTPALSAFWLRYTWQVAANIWSAFWTVSFVAFLIHFYWAVAILFGGDWQRILISPQLVSAPILDTIITIWWGLDVALAWTIQLENKWIRTQRLFVHGFVLILFFAASVMQGSFLISRILGIVMSICVIGAFGLWLWRWLMNYEHASKSGQWTRQRTVRPGLSHLILTFGSWIWEKLTQNKPWYNLGFPLWFIKLIEIRVKLREHNLFPRIETALNTQTSLADKHEHNHKFRTADGTYNDLNDPTMGSAGTNFGRNFPPAEITYPDTEVELLGKAVSNPDHDCSREINSYSVKQNSNQLLPSPRTLSLELMTRHEFKPAKELNLLAAAWIQFMIHDWFRHGGGNNKDGLIEIKLAKDDPWPEQCMKIARTPGSKIHTQSTAGYSRFHNTETHWWDGSQIYGSTPAIQNTVRSKSEGKLIVGEKGLLPLDPNGIEISGVTSNWWLGLSLLHTLFTWEHNAICDHLIKAGCFGRDQDEELFQTARLINAALMAKIHTVEWTPAILPNPKLEWAMRINWWGIMGERFHNWFGRISDNEVISGIPGSPTNHHRAPYAITEEFVAVYRMHPLLPDNFCFRSWVDDKVIQMRTFPHVAGTHARHRLEEMDMADILYSFGTSHPGAITLHNYPCFLQRFRKQDKQNCQGERFVDVAAIDILRDRERGIPPYNQFRQLLHLPRVETFEELNKEYADDIRRLYNNDIDKVDLMVGLFAETPPPGFGFSETAFRIFGLMASRRLKSDRYFTTDYTPEVYTQAGMDWIAKSNMSAVIGRHFTDLRPLLSQVNNPFKPWRQRAE